MEQLTDHLELLKPFGLSNNDLWAVCFGDSSYFTVKCMRPFIEQSSLPSLDKLVRWNNFIPIKVNINSWRIINERLPTHINLDKRGIDLHSTRCPVCDNAQETEIYLFTQCPIALKLWNDVKTFWNLDYIDLSNLNGIITTSDSLEAHAVVRKGFDVVVQFSFGS